MSQKEIIIKQLERVFNGPAWHGPSVLETLAKASDSNINNSFKNSHSQIEIIGHMTAWRIYVIEILKGNEKYSVTEEMNFPKSSNPTEAIRHLKESQHQLLESILNFPEERLPEKVLDKPFSFQAVLHGIIHHDLYHLGQIGLLNR